jgi:hypothetical protein
MPIEPGEEEKPVDGSQEATFRDELVRRNTDKRKKAGRFVLSALSSIPWVGGFLSASANLDAEADQGRVNDLQRQWMDEHRAKLEELARTLAQLAERIDAIGPDAGDRAQTDEYLGLVRKGFGVWDRADTQEKRDFIRHLLSNAAGTSLADDDLVRLFIDWIERYHESHFAVIRAIYKNPGATRSEIWQAVYGRKVRENSAEADLFKLLVRDLSTGSVIRQHRETTADGEFLRKPRAPVRRGGASSVVKSAFDEVEGYELTELGMKFVHYVLSDAVTRIGDST